MFNSILKRNWSDEVIVRPKKLKKLPYVLSKDEIILIMNHIPNVKHKNILLTAYSAGLRISEVLNLNILDIDSNKMLM
jgi:integrase